MVLNWWTSFLCAFFKLIQYVKGDDLWYIATSLLTRTSSHFYNIPNLQFLLKISSRLQALFFKNHRKVMSPCVVCRDVYYIESIISFRYFKTDTSIVSKWQINDTFNDTFYDYINKDRASLTHKWMIFFIKCMFCFHFYTIWKIIFPEYYYTVCWVYQKAKRRKVNFLMVWYHILSYRYRFVSISIVSYRKKIKGTHP